MAAKQYINGYGGNITFAAVALDVMEWTLDIMAEAIDTTNTGDLGWVSNILGPKEYSGTCKTFFDTAAVQTGVAGFIPGARGAFVFKVGESLNEFSGNAQITKISVSNPVKGVVTFDLDFKGYGVLVVPT